MSDQAPPSRKSVLHSPWYWAYAFCAAGLIALLLLGGKVVQRQSQIERQHVGRGRTIARQAARTADRAASSPSPGPSALGPEDKAAKSNPPPAVGRPTGLAPFYGVLIVGLLLSWIALWWTHFRRGASRTV